MNGFRPFRASRPRSGPLEWGLVASCLATAAALTGCDTPGRTIDPFPIDFDQRSGAVVAQASFDGATPVPVILDTLSPVTTQSAGPDTSVRQRRVSLTVYSVDDSIDATVPRAQYDGTRLFDLHPCGDQTFCRVGSETENVEVRGVVGFDVLGRSAVTFDFPAGQIQLSPDIAGDNRDRRLACEAEFPSPFVGGGTLRIGEEEQAFSGRRPAMRTCLAPGEDLSSVDQGSDALLIIATGLPISLLSESGYERYRASFSGLPAISELEGRITELSTGRAQLKVAQIPGIALVGRTQNERGACRELYASRVMAAGGCDATGVRDCPCPTQDNQRFCRSEAAVQVRRSVDFGIIADEDPLLQALRDELRPGLAEVDGLLSAADLRDLRVAFDYPNGRILMRCETSETCLTRPVVVSSAEALLLSRRCPGDPDAGPM